MPTPMATPAANTPTPRAAATLTTCDSIVAPVSVAVRDTAPWASASLRAVQASVLEGITLRAAAPEPANDTQASARVAAALAAIDRALIEALSVADSVIPPLSARMPLSV